MKLCYISSVMKYFIKFCYYCEACLLNSGSVGNTLLKSVCSRNNVLYKVL